MQAIDRLHDCLRQLSGRQLTSGEWRDREGVVRLRARQIAWEGYVRLAFEELTLAGAGSPQVARRLFAAVEGRGHAVEEFGHGVAAALLQHFARASLAGPGAVFAKTSLSPRGAVGRRH